MGNTREQDKLARRIDDIKSQARKYPLKDPYGLPRKEPTQAQKNVEAFERRYPKGVK